MDTLVERLVKIVPRDSQIKWQQLEFTAFLHFGMNTFTGNEWGHGNEDLSIFNPEFLDTDQWCESLVKAGIKACIYTAKHHDGFCMWDTKYTDHSVMNTVFKRDIVGELSQSCQKYGLKFGVYLSPWDRHELTYGQGRAYDDYFCNQLTELLTNYGEVYTVWFDGACGEGPNGKEQQYNWDRYYELIRKLQPNAVISVCGPDVRWCGNEAGDCRPSEWSVVSARLADKTKIQADSQQSDDHSFREMRITTKDMDLGSREAVRNEKELIWYPAEVDMSIRPGWFYHAEEDHLVKSVEELFSVYLNSVGGNAVFLLNIPPNKEGLISKYDKTRLEELGNYIKEAFSHNYMEKAIITSDSTQYPYVPENTLTDNDMFWKAEDGCEACKLTIVFPEKTEVKYIVLQEQIQLSQRIEAFSVYAGNDLNEIYNGTTVGYKKICHLPHGIETDRLILSIKKSRICPTLKHIGIY